MDDATVAEMELIRDEAAVHRRDHWLGTVVRLLESMKGYTFGYRVDRYEHSLQSATRAHREGARVDLVVAALLHDIGDDLCPDNHSEVAAAILRPVLDDEAVWVVRHHGVFQTFTTARSWAYPRTARPVPGFAVLRHCAILRRVGPGVLRSRIRFGAARILHADARGGLLPGRPVWGDQDLAGQAR